MNKILLLALALTASAASAADPTWIPSWYAGPAPVSGESPELRNLTIREIVHVSAGGSAVRLRLSNAFGNHPLHIDKIAIALRASGGAIRAGSVAVTFSGKPGVTVVPGGDALSDPVAFTLPDHADLAVSLYAAGPVEASTAHLVQRNAIYFAPGEAVDAPTLAKGASDPATGQSWLWLEEVEVAGSSARQSIVAFGDSITDGVGPKADSNATWPDFLSQRLEAAGIPLGIANAGIGGNRLLHHATWPPFGQGALTRFDSAVLAQPNILAAIVLLGINDIGQVGERADAGEYVSPEDIVAGLTQLAARAKEKGIRIYVGTLLPFRGMPVKGYYSDAKEKDRQAVNAWIRANKVFDGVVDFDKTADDPAASGQLRPAFDSGDHLHLTAAGEKALADAIPLSWFRAEAKGRKN